jgi:O-antigen ligase
MAIGIGLTYYCRFARIPAKWISLTVTIGLFVTVVFLTTINPLGWIFNHFTLDASTGYFRLMIWDAAGADVMESPIFGIGATNDWFRPSWMPNSVDSLWLRCAMLYGIPGSLLIALAVIAASVPAVRRTPLNARRVTARDILLAESLDIITFLTIFLGFTVFYWGSAWITLGLLAGLRAYLGQHAAD